MIRNKLQILCALVIVSSMAPAAIALQTADPDKQLASLYVEKAFRLTTPYCGRTLQFDAEGKLLNGGSPGAWTMCQNIRVKQIRRNGNNVEIDGKRIYLRYASSSRRFVDVDDEADKHSKSYEKLVDGQQVRIRISLPTAQGGPEIQTIVDRVLTSGELDSPVSDSRLWQEFFLKRQQTGQEKPVPPVPEEDGDALEVIKGISYPKPVSMPEPSYTDEARLSKYMGMAVFAVIVDSEGKVRNVKVVRPLGLGLDENAEKAVRTWQFKPALRDGKPVTVRIQVEVNFNLY